MHHDHPQLVKDQYWDEVFPQELPYTLAAEPFRDVEPQSSTANINVKPQAQGIVANPSSVKIDGLQSQADINSGITFTAKPSSSNLAKKDSQASIATPVGSIVRNNSVTNVLKRLFSKEEKSGDKGEQETIELIQPTQIDAKPTIGSTKIVNQVIPEVVFFITCFLIQN